MEVKAFNSKTASYFSLVSYEGYKNDYLLIMIPTGVEWLHFSETTSFTFEGTAGPKNCVLFRFGKCRFLPAFVLLMEVKMVPASYLVVHLAQFYKTCMHLTPIRLF